MLDEKEGRLRTEAFLIPQDTPADAAPDTYLTTIDEIERRTGLDLLPELPTATQTQLESTRASRTW